VVLGGQHLDQVCRKFNTVDQLVFTMHELLQAVCVAPIT